MNALNMLRLRLLFIFESLNLGIQRFVFLPPTIAKKRRYVEMRERCYRASYDKKAHKYRKGVRGK